MHYSGCYKPWKDPSVPLAHYFWKYARQTPFYEEFLFQNINKSHPQPASDNVDLLKLLVHGPKILFHYYRCKILSKVTWGNKRKHYKQKRDKLHEQVRKIRMFLK